METWRAAAWRTPGGPGVAVLRYDVLDRFAELAAKGRFSVPVAPRQPILDMKKIYLEEAPRRPYCLSQIGDEGEVRPWMRR
jgi:hypothetical protein